MNLNYKIIVKYYLDSFYNRWIKKGKVIKSKEVITSRSVLLEFHSTLNTSCVVYCVVLLQNHFRTPIRFWINGRKLFLSMFTYPSALRLLRTTTKSVLCPLCPPKSWRCHRQNCIVPARNVGLISRSFACKLWPYRQQSWPWSVTRR
jgi:hypothetical protein